jgi:hypothetical protein
MLTPKKMGSMSNIPDVSLYAFKSPAPSHYKQKMAAVGQPFNQMGGRDQGINAGSILGKSPHMLNKSRFGDSSSKMMFGGGGNGLVGQYFAGTNATNGTLDNSSRWLISPVCSRFRDHIQMANGGAAINDSIQKMRRGGGDSLGNSFLHSPMMVSSNALDI